MAWPEHELVEYMTPESASPLHGQVAIVTGAGRGIALELASLGADVAVAELNRESALHTASEIQQRGRRAVAVGVDVTRAEDRQAMVDQTLGTFTRIDILVNNAGIHSAGTPLEVTEEHWDTILGVNARAVFFCAQAVLPTMLGARRGVIVNIASMAGKLASIDALPYAVSKAAVISMTRSLALTYARDGIRVNCVCPGHVQTDMFSQIDTEVGVADGANSQASFRANCLRRFRSVEPFRDPGLTLAWSLPNLGIVVPHVVWIEESDRI